MYGVVREFQPPLGVTHAVRGKFGTGSSVSTIFARKNSLDLYIVRANLESARLEHLSSIFLGSTIVSLAVARRPSAPSDFLFVGFERMRIAILSWQPDRYSWATEQLLDLGKLLGSGSISVDESTQGLDSKCKWHPLIRGSSGAESDPLIQADPSGHCVAILSKTHSILYVLPIRSEDEFSESGHAVNTSSMFVIDLHSEYDVSNVKGFTFLHDMFEPHISILYETKRTWSGRTAVQRNTCSLLTISVDLRSKRSANFWGLDQLPYDCDQVEAVPDSARGGVLVISSGVIMQIRHGMCVAGLSLNCYGDAYAIELRSKYETIKKSDTLVECDASHCRFLDVEETLGNSTQSIALLSLKGGELYFLHVAIDSQSCITMKRAGSTVIASEIVPINERFFILPSRLSDSLLIEYNRIQEEGRLDDSVEDEALLSGSITNSKKKNKNKGESKNKKRSKVKKRKRTEQEDDEYEIMYGVKPPQTADDDSDESSEDQERTLDLNENDEQGTRGVYDDDDELGFVFKSDSASGLQQGPGTWVLTVKDTIPCFGPGADITMGPSPKDVTQSKLDLVVAGGYAKNGCLAVVQQFIRPSTFTEFPMPECEGVWTLIDPCKIRRHQKERAERNVEIIQRNEGRRIRNAKAKESRREFLQKAVAQLKEEKKQEMLSISNLAKNDLEMPGGQSNMILPQHKFEATLNPKDNDTEGVADQKNIGSIVDDVNHENMATTDEEKTLDKTETTIGESQPPITDNEEEEKLVPEFTVMDQDQDTSQPKANAERAPTEGFKQMVIGKATENLSTMKGDEMKDISSDSKNGRGDTNVEPTTLEEKSEQETDEKEETSDNIDSLFNESSLDQQSKIDQGEENISTKEESTTKRNDLNRPQKRPRSSDIEDNALNENGESLDVINVELDKEEVARLRHEIEANIPLEEEESIETALGGEDSFHSYMLLSTPSSTVVLSTDSDLEEAMPGTTDFLTSEKTIAAGNILKDHAMVQVVSKKVRILMDGRLQCEHEIDEEHSIKQAQISDPLILLHMEHEEVIVLEVEAEEFNLVESQDKDDQEFGDDEFDEYGMAVSKDSPKDVNKSFDQDPKGNDSKTKQTASKSYRNFSIQVDFDSDKLDEKLNISSSFLYNGPLATEIAEDGLLNIQEKDKDTFEDETNETKDPAKDESTLSSGEDATDKSEKETRKTDVPSVDDEDRMLYGDEGDKLLYGAMEDGTSNNKGAQSDSLTANESTKGSKASGIASTDESLKKKKAQLSEKGTSLLEAFTALENQAYLLVMTTIEGGLRILSRELNYATILECPYLFTIPNFLMDTKILEDRKGDNGPTKMPPPGEEYRISQVMLTEVMASCKLPGFTTPFLLFTSNSGLPVLYRAFMQPGALVKGQARSRLAFKRIVFRDGTTRWQTRLMKKFGAVRQSKSEKLNGLAPPHHNEHIIGPLRPSVFENIGGRSGIFLGGDCPAFLFAERGHPRIHELSYISQVGEVTSREKFEDGQGVLSFTEFHNVSCPRGFVAVGADNVIRIGGLPEPREMNYDVPTPFYKIALRCTPHKVAYHGGSATYGVLASMPTLTTREEKLAQILQSLEKHDKRHYQHTAAQAEAETGDDRTDRVPPLFEELHELRVYRPDNWNLIRSHKLQKGEVGLAITNMKINVFKQQMAGPGIEIPASSKGDDGNESLFAASIKLRPKDMLVVGTGYLNGEDASSRGRLLLFEISKQEVYTEAGGMYTAFQLQLIAEKEVLSPVTAVASMEGYVIAGVGPLVSVYKLVGDEIVHLSFAFGQLYCSSIASLKQYVVAADMCKSLSFMYFRDRNNSVNFLAQDYESVTCYATEFLVDNENMGLIVSDETGNVRLLNYVHASEPKSRGGKRLLMNGGIHIGSRVNKFVRVRVPDKEAMLTSGEAARRAGSHALMFATLDGGIGALVGVDEKEFKWMNKAWKVVNEFEGIRRSGGVNMEELCALRHGRGGTELLSQRLLDSRCVFEVFEMTLFEMSAVSRQCGVKANKFAEKLLALDTVLWRF